MDRLEIRPAVPEDIPGICRVNRGEPGPWAHIESCTAHVLNRMKNGFYVQIAVLSGQIVGHAEWIVSDTYRGRSFYLGQLQVEPSLQKRGVGRRMIEDGIRRARLEGCGTVTLIPEPETGSEAFYEKCGCTRGREIVCCRLPALPGETDGIRAEEAPHGIVKSLPFVFGLTQTSAEHMWQVYNRESELSGRQVDTLIGGDFCIQIGGFDRKKDAFVLAWSGGDIPGLIRTAQAFAHACGYPGAAFHFFSEYDGYFPKELTEPEGFEMYLEL